MENTNELQESSTVFDDVFRTMLERIPEIMIPLINEIFSTDYPDNEPIIQLKNKHFRNYAGTKNPPVFYWKNSMIFAPDWSRR